MLHLSVVNLSLLLQFDTLLISDNHRILIYEVVNWLHKNAWHDLHVVDKDCKPRIQKTCQYLFVANERWIHSAFWSKYL